MRFVAPCSVVALILSASGCVVVNQKSTTLTIDLTFGGITTCGTAGVDALRISSADADQRFATQTVDCDTQFLLTPLVPDTYRVRIEALAAGTVIYSSTVEVEVPGTGTEVSVDLEPIGFVADFIFGAPNESGSNPPGMTCAEAGVKSVSVVIDNGSPLVANCHDEGSNRDAAIVPINTGTHTFKWSAFASTDATGTALYTNTFPNVSVTPNSELLFNMDGTSNGGFTVNWQLSNGSTCPISGVTTITYDVHDSSGAELPALPQSVLCDSSNGGFSYAASNPGLRPGVFFVDIKAKDSSGNVVYAANNARVYAPAGVAKTFAVTLQ